MLACPRCGSSYLRDVVFCGLDGERLVEVEADPLVGRQIDRYLVEEILGDGGMARVYRATHVHLGQPCALKILFGDMASDRTLAERFRREAQSSAQIRHPNVVQVTDFGTSPEGLTFMAMELLVGQTLADRLKGERVISPGRAADIVRQIALGLSAAHAHGFVHRDLKPRNVMLTPEPTGERVKILDFGLVRPLNQGDERLTAQGQVFGTPPYMAPEQISGAPVDPRTDLYALGAITYEILAGRPPFSGPMAEVFKKHLSLAPPPLHDQSGLAELALVLLAKSPDARPPSAGHVVELIDGLQLTFISGRPGALVPDLEPRSAPFRPPEPTPSGPPAPAPLGQNQPSPSHQDTRPRSNTPLRRGPPDPLGVELFDSLELDEQQIRSMVQRSRSAVPVILVIGVLLLAALAAGAWWIHRRPATPTSETRGATAKPSDPTRPSTRGSSAVLSTKRPKEPSPDPKVDGPAILPPAPTRTSSAQVAPNAPTPSAPTVPAAAAPAQSPAHEQSSDASSSFQGLDRGMLWLLSQRGLSLWDLAGAEPQATLDWAGWQRRPSDAGSSEEILEAYELLAKAAKSIPIDQSLIRSKLDRVQKALDRVPQDRRTDAFSRSAGQWAVLADEAKATTDAAAWPSLSTRLTLLEAQVEGLAGP